ncbi:MAG: tetratricopeptide repeat protein [Candidatus Omnitrophica bacterium]|nr:tetratricopeptide repeat protein [Candidatus Omnitrophota bacterium]
MRNALLALLILGTASYFNAVGNPFVHDDIVFILENPKVHDIASISSVFAPNSFVAHDIALANPYYRPFLDIVYRLEYWLFGKSAVGYHLVNILLHFANAVLIFVLSLRLTQRRGFAWCVAALFLVHPVQTESVACISGISNLLFSFFMLCALLQYMRTADQNQEYSLGKEVVNYSTALVFFGAALLSKEQAIVLPLIVLLYEFAFPRLSGKNNAGWRLRFSGLIIVAGGYLLWRKLITGGFATSLIANVGEFYLRLKSLAGIVLNHLHTIFWPMDLHYYRSYDILLPWLWPMVGLVFLVFACILIWRVLPRSRQPLFAFGLGWFVITLLPTTSIIPLVHEYSFIAAFEHFLYLPLVGILWSTLVVLEYFSEHVFHKSSVRLKKIVMAVVLGICVLLTFVQTKMWASETALFEKAAHYENDLGRVHLLLAKAYFSQHDYQKAKAEFLTARNIMTNYLQKIQDQRVKPFYVGFLKESLLGIAACEEAVGNLAGAKEQYEKIVVIAPEDSDVQNYFGYIMVRMEKWDDAVIHFEQALKINPRNAQALANLGVCFIQLQEPDKGEEYLRRSLAIDPNLISARQNLEFLLKQNDMKDHP